MDPPNIWICGATLSFHQATHPIWTDRDVAVEAIMRGTTSAQKLEQNA
jgi:hypothetical protein